MARITSLVAGNASLSEIADAIADMLGYPVCIIDDVYTLLASSRDFERLVPEFCDDEVNGFVNVEAQRELDRSTVMHPLGVRNYAAKYQVSMPDGSIMSNYLSLIYIGTVAVGSFSVFARNEEMPRDTLALLPSIANLLSCALRFEGYAGESLGKSARLTSLLSSLANVSPLLMAGEENVRRRFAFFGYALRRYKRVLYFDMSDAGLGDVSVRQLAERFRKDGDGHFVYYLDGADVVMLSSYDARQGSSGIKRDAVERWRRTAGGDTSIRCGISDSFENMADFGKAIGQARRAAHIGAKMSPGSTVFRYDELRTFDLFSHLKDGVSLSGFYYPSLMRVFDYDAENGTELVRTLREYIKHPDHLQTVCDSLGVHRNTLHYRLERISKIMGDKDVRSSEVYGQIHLTFAMLAYEGKLDL